MPDYDYKLYTGDCLEVLKNAPSDRVSAVVTDPPYGLSNKKPDMNEVLTHWMNGDDYHHRGSGFMNKKWDAFVPGPATWKEVIRVLKPGGMALVFSGTRMSDLMGISLRLAGFEIIDTIHWTYGSGFPKAQNVSVLIDKKMGYERSAGNYVPNDKNAVYGGGMGGGHTTEKTESITPEAKKWEGWKTPALKPAHEHIILCRKPFKGSTTDNVLNHGVGAINIDASRVGSEKMVNTPAGNQPGGNSLNMSVVGMPQDVEPTESSGRYPSNFILTHSPDCEYIGEKKVKGSPPGVNKVKPYGSERTMGVSSTPPQETTHYADKDGNETVAEYICDESCPIRLLDEQSGELHSRGNKSPTKRNKSEGVWGEHGSKYGIGPDGPVDSGGQAGGASRFFKQCNYSDIDYDIFRYQAKASKSERGAANSHPTVKPQKLLEYLITLVTPEGGVVLDPFAGSGSTGVAAINNGFKPIMIEHEQEYVDICQQRISDALALRYENSKNEH